LLVLYEGNKQDSESVIAEKLEQKVELDDTQHTLKLSKVIKIEKFEIKRTQQRKMEYTDNDMEEETMIQNEEKIESKDKQQQSQNSLVSDADRVKETQQKSQKAFRTDADRVRFSIQNFGNEFVKTIGEQQKEIMLKTCAKRIAGDIIFDVHKDSLRNLPNCLEYVKGDIINRYAALLDSFVSTVESLERVIFVQSFLIDKLREIRSRKLDLGLFYKKKQKGGI
jgi:uncharacterized membrane-anchored protein YjiN (DUF445 family)